MEVKGASCLVTGAASGLGAATAKFLADRGSHVVIVDLPGSRGAELAAEIGNGAVFAAADITDPDTIQDAVNAALSMAPLRAVVHCAGRGGPVRILDREGKAGSQEAFDAIVRTNLSGSFNVLRLAAEAIAKNEPLGGERGVIVLTASVAAYEGQIGQIPYASSKAGVVGMTLVAARDLANRLIRVCTIAPGLFDTPMLARVPEEIRAGLAASVPNPSRLGAPDEYARLAAHIIENPMLNGETIRLDGAIRMAPR